MTGIRRRGALLATMAAAVVGKTPATAAGTTPAGAVAAPIAPLPEAPPACFGTLQRLIASEEGIRASAIASPIPKALEAQDICGYWDEHYIELIRKIVQDYYNNNKELLILHYLGILEHLKQPDFAVLRTDIKNYKELTQLASVIAMTKSINTIEGKEQFVENLKAKRLELMRKYGCQTEIEFDALSEKILTAKHHYGEDPQDAARITASIAHLVYDDLIKAFPKIKSSYDREDNYAEVREKMVTDAAYQVAVAIISDTGGDLSRPEQNGHWKFYLRKEDLPPGWGDDNSPPNFLPDHKAQSEDYDIRVKTIPFHILIAMCTRWDEKDFYEDNPAFQIRVPYIRDYYLNPYLRICYLEHLAEKLGLRLPDDFINDLKKQKTHLERDLSSEQGENEFLKRKLGEMKGKVDTLFAGFSPNEIGQAAEGLARLVVGRFLGHLMEDPGAQSVTAGLEITIAGEARESANTPPLAIGQEISGTVIIDPKEKAPVAAATSIGGSAPAPI